jgi:hypothetical protein
MFVGLLSLTSILGALILLAIRRGPPRETERLRQTHRPLIVSANYSMLRGAAPVCSGASRRGGPKSAGLSSQVLRRSRA